MPIIKSAAKRMRQNSKRASINNRYRREMRAATKQFQADVAKTNEKSASESLSAAQKAIDRATKKGILHKNTGARRKSRLARMYDEAFSTKKSTAKKPAAKASTAKKKPASKAKSTKSTTKKAPAKKTTKKS